MPQGLHFFTFTQGAQGTQGTQGPRGELPSPSLNAAIPYEPWHLDNSTASFPSINHYAYCIQFFAPSTAEYTNLYLYLYVWNINFEHSLRHPHHCRIAKAVIFHRNDHGVIFNYRGII